jgi:predicted lipid-binding transport protein (Tim44 family)
MLDYVKTFFAGMFFIIVIVIGAGLYMKFNPTPKPVVAQNATTQSTTANNATVTVKPAKPNECPEVIVTSSGTASTTQNNAIASAPKRKMKIGVGVNDLLHIPSNFNSIQGYYIQFSYEALENIDIDVRVNGKKEVSMGVGIKF